jgi:hypothetical protein
MRPNMAGGIAAFWRFDLNDLCTQLREEHGTVRAGTILLCGKYAEAL